MSRATIAALWVLAATGCKRADPPAEEREPRLARSLFVPDDRPPLPVPTASPKPLALLVGGDVDLGRALGQRLVKAPDYRPFAHVDRWLSGADVRFVNLESPLSDQGGELQSPHNPLVFNGPPHAAKTLAAAGIDIVSTANNHAFDYGESGVLGTLRSLQSARVESVGTGPFRTLAEEPRVFERGGRKIVFLAGTDVWNQGASLPARAYVADAEPTRLIAAITTSKQRMPDCIVVSVHAGEEYQDAPVARVRTLFRSLVDAGADVVVGHHPHVPQGVEWHAGKPIFYSLGNFVMRMHDRYPDTGTSFLGRVVCGDRGISVAICPFRIVGHEPRPLADDPAHEALLAAFETRFRGRNRGLGEATLGPWQADGCAPLPAP